jgi:hypothetical protein
MADGFTPARPALFPIALSTACPVMPEISTPFEATIMAHIAAGAANPRPLKWEADFLLAVLGQFKLSIVPHA